MTGCHILSDFPIFHTSGVPHQLNLVSLLVAPVTPLLPRQVAHQVHPPANTHDATQTLGHVSIA
jgi:hypothetical protein